MAVETGYTGNTSTKTRTYYGGNKWGGGSKVKGPEDRRGIAAAVAVNNVFGNLNFTELMDVSLNSMKLNQLLRLTETLANKIVEFTDNVKAANVSS